MNAVAASDRQIRQHYVRYMQAAQQASIRCGGADDNANRIVQQFHYRIDTEIIWLANAPDLALKDLRLEDKLTILSRLRFKHYRSMLGESPNLDSEAVP